MRKSHCSGGGEITQNNSTTTSLKTNQKQIPTKPISNSKIRYILIAIIAVFLILVVFITIIKTSAKKTQRADSTEDDTSIITSNSSDEDSTRWPAGMYVYDGGPKGRIDAYQFEDPNIVYYIYEGGKEEKYTYKFINDQMLVKLDGSSEGWEEENFKYDAESKTLIYTNYYSDKQYYKYAGEGRPRTNSSDSSNDTSVTDVESFDPFEGIEISFKGISGEGTATIEGDLQGLTAKITPSDSMLKNGDEITVEIDDSNIDIYIAQHNRKPIKTKQTYTVTNLDTYEISDEDVTEELRNYIYTNASQALEDSIPHICGAKIPHLLNKIDNEPSDYWKVSGRITGDPVPVKLVIGNRKPDNNYNKIFVLYKVPYEAYVKSDLGDGSNTGDIIGAGESYFLTELDGLLIMSDGYSLQGTNWQYKWAFEKPGDADISINKERDEYSFKEYNTK